MKATHTGICQICGSRQKLPKGVLSKHGYTVQQGWFSGICTGAGYLPIEQSHDRISDAILSVQAGIADLNREISELQTTTDYVWVSVYYFDGAAQYTKGRVEERHSRESIIKSSINNEKFFVLGHQLRPALRDAALESDHRSRHATVLNQYETLTLDEAIKKNNSNRICALQRRIAQGETYIAWQQDRIANWKLQDLQPVEP